MSAARPLRLELSASPAFAALVILVHAVAAACVAVVLPGVPGMLLALALVGLGLVATWSRALLRSARSIRAIELRSADDAILELRNGSRLEAQVARRRYVGRWLVAFSVTRPVRRTVVVAGDMLPGAAFRRLRIWAAWGKAPGIVPNRLAV